MLTRETVLLGSILNAVTNIVEKIPHIMPWISFFFKNIKRFNASPSQIEKTWKHMQSPPKPTEKPVKKAQTELLTSETEARVPSEISISDDKRIIAFEFLMWKIDTNTSFITVKNTVKPQISSIDPVHICIELDNDVINGLDFE